MSGEVIIKPVNRPVILNPSNPTTVYKPSSGITGPPGPGVPAGGATNDVLTKSSGTDYDTEWKDVSDLSTEIFAEERFHFVQSVASTVWTVTHNLGRYPIVAVTDSAGTEVYGDVVHLSLNQAQLNFQSPFSGSAEFI